MKTRLNFWSFVLSVFFCFESFAQIGTPQQLTGQKDDETLNTITTAVPFLIISPDSRSGAMGDVGVALSPDANSIHWNPSKLAFAEEELELSLSVSPWLSQLVDDMYLSYLSGYRKLNSSSAIGASLRFFSLGDITFTDINGQEIRVFKPSEFALDGSYAIKLSEKFSGGITARYVNSNLTGGINVGGAESRPGRSFAVDVSGYYVNDDMELGNKDATLAFGFNISNIGSKMAYTNTADRDFIPTNLRLGPALTLDLDDYNSLTFAFDINKLLVPTPPVYFRDSLGTPEIDPATGEFLIAAGRDPNVGVASGIFGSFSDAPGNVSIFQNGDVEVESGSVFREEMREFNIGAGIEYWYDKQFALRSGYFYEHPTKGDRQFFTFGLGMKFRTVAFDASYLVAAQQRNPLANTIRISLKLNFNGSSSVGGDDGPPQE
ncbi:MAG: type IX secretion system outer membrane channel protein PorV [Bacteroidota bacterium]